LRRDPLFGGYLLVAVVAAWLVGIALRGSDILPAHAAPWTWLALTGVCAMLATLAALLTPLLARNRVGAHFLALRLLLAVGLLGAFLALGAARTAWTDPATDSTSVARYANGASVRLRGEVVAEPDLRDGARLLTVEVSSIRLGDNGPTQPASGRIMTAYYGPDDWFAPACGDTLSLTGELASLNGRYAPPGVVAELAKARSVIVDRNGGNPILARLFELRLALAQAIQRALPEPEAALLIGILLGLKTPVLRSRLALFTMTGTITSSRPVSRSRSSPTPLRAPSALSDAGCACSARCSRLAPTPPSAVAEPPPCAPRSWARCSSWPPR
jgi:competence protein ComEC